MSVERIYGAYSVNAGFGRANQPVAYRGTSIAHRTAVTAVDKLAVPTALTVVDVATGGSLLASTTYHCTWAANTLLGPTTVPANGDVATAADASNTHVARLTTVQVPNAVSYDLFVSTAAAPLWVARITEAQRAAGCTVTAVGTVTATSPGANKVDVQVVGTGVASTANPFAINNAYDLAAITPIDCTGYNIALIQAAITVTDLRSAPTLNFAAFTKIGGAPTRWVAPALNSGALLTALQRPLQGFLQVSILGATALAVAVDTISGQGTSVDFWVDLL